MPSEVRLIPDMESFRYVTAAFLLAREDLSLISIWNPTFLTALLDAAHAHAAELVRDIADGTLRPPAPLDRGVARRLDARLRADPDRAAEVAAAFAAARVPSEANARIWPRLRAVSCWADAYAARYIPALAAALPQSAIAPKGLVATEALVTFPLRVAGGHVLAARSHYVEFEPESGGEPVPAWLAEPGRRYGIVVTTGGGLYRYRMHDLVEVTGRWHTVPVLRFLGKDGLVSDRFGEKVAESHVRRVLERLASSRGIVPAWAMVACEDYAGVHAYTLFIDAPGGERRSSGLAEDLEASLLEGFHYRYARRLGQLGPARVAVVREGSRRHLDESVRRGRRAGDVKPLALSVESGWSEPLGARTVAIARAHVPRGDLS